MSDTASSPTRWKLNLGCGRLPLEGFVNVDSRGGDLLAVASRLPFRERSFEYILAAHILEHVPDLDQAVREIHRVLAMGGLVEVRVPTGFRTLYNPFHLRTFNLHTMDAYCVPSGFSLEKQRLFDRLSSEVNAWELPLQWHLRKYAMPLLQVFRRLGLFRREHGKELWKVPLWRRAEIRILLRTRAEAEAP
ncbi:MAG: methyltransferase domain-containing protein [candidate division NC10 bacterium]